MHLVRRLGLALVLTAGALAASTSTPVAAGPTPGWDTVSAGEEHTCAVKEDNTLWCWGRDNFGQLGNGAATGIRNRPIQIGAASDWLAVGAGNLHTCAIQADHSLWCWGLGDEGELGTGGTVQRNRPAAVDGGHTDWTAVSAGRFHTCGIRVPGTLWCWGDDQYGQIGNGAPRATETTPVQVGTDTDWVQVGAGESSTCGRRSTGQVFCWGRDYSGQLGNGAASSANRLVPVEVFGHHTDWTAISVGRLHVCGVRSPGALWCWGFNDNGELGDGTITTRVSPRLVHGGFTDWVAVDASQGQFQEHTCATRNGGHLYCWGPDSGNQLGNGPGVSAIVTTPQPVTGPATGWTDVSGGARHTCGRRGVKLYCWGTDTYGQLGNGPPLATRSSPVEILP